MTNYFLCPRPAAPSGGVWLIHRLVELLNEIGQESYVFTPQPFAVWWDQHPIPQRMVRETIQPGRGDTVVVPEVLWPTVDMNGSRELLFVQNYIWLDKYGFQQKQGDTLVCSRFLANHMERVFDARVVGMLSPFLDNDVWDSPQPKIPGRVLLLNRRGPDLAEKMRAALEASGAFSVDFVTEPLSQAELASHFREAEYYVHLVYPEGLPMICLEAMRSGTLVVGTTGGGGNEFMSHDYTAWVVQDPENGRYFNQDEFVKRIMEGLFLLRGDADRRARICQMAYEWSRRYNRDNTIQQLKQVFA